MEWAILFIIGCVILGASGEILFKVGVGKLGEFNLGSAGEVLSNLVRMAGSPLILAGFLCYGVAAVLWIYALSRLDLSFAYPMYALMYAIIPLAAYFILKEQIPTGRWVGILLIILGVYIVFQFGRNVPA
ncbi:MAG: EamA family transporter [Methanomicrobiales archaeon]|nr:EamA family transporter [Methanomicrobiales archaeon]MDD1654570.1 EamA family transporter [Methanomicrobiales archaeon]